VSLVLSGLLVGGSSFAETPKGSAEATGALSITTDPGSATVYLDGRLAGQTPAHLVSIPAGDHRVRIVKNGYLENSRMVTVTSGAPTTVNVKLTRTAGSVSDSVEQVSSTGGGGGGSKKWLWIALAGGGGAAAIIALSKKNSAPTPGTITISPTGTGMAGITAFTLTSNASDSDGDTLSFAWNFGDGGTGTGSSTTHTYAGTGSFGVSLAVNDGHSNTANAPNATVVVGPAVGGLWTGGNDSFFGCGINTNFTQSGTALTGTMPFVGNCSGTVTLASGSTSGTTHPTNVTWATVPFTFTTPTGTCSASNGGCPNLVFSFTGATDTSGTTLAGTLTLKQTSSAFTTSNTTSFKHQ
jgi:hypothetical protein